MTTWAFTKSSRLLNSAQFQRIFQQAVFKVSHQRFLILASPNQLELARLGLVVGKKHCRLAVQRNRIKRHIRETFRYQQHHLAGIDAIVLPRSGADQLSDQEIHLILEQLWQRLLGRCQTEQNPETTKS